jgi:uncharacterized membrane protein
MNTNSQITNYKLQITFLILSAFLLFFNLGGRDYWSDEIFSLPKIDNPKVVLAQSSWDVHPPLFFLLEYYWIEIWGKSEFATRSLSSIFGLAVIILAYALAKRMLPRGNLNFYFLTLVTSPFFLFYARMTRYYALTGALCLAVILTFHRLTEKEDWKRRLLYWTSALLLLYEDYVGFILLSSLSLYYFWRNRRNPKVILIYLLGVLSIFVLYLPWIGNLLYNAGVGAAPYPEIRPNSEFRLAGYIVYNIVQSLLRIVYTLYNFTLGETVFPWNPLILAGIMGAVILLFFALRNRKTGGDFWFYALLLPFGLYILSVAFYSKVFSAANFALLPSKMLFLQPLWLMFLFTGQTGKRKAFTIGVTLLLGFNLYSAINYHLKTEHLNPKYIVPWREMAEEISSQATVKDVVITDEETLGHYLKGSKLKIYGLVDADKFVAEQEPPLKVFLAIRHRGEESIYREGIRIKNIFDNRYGTPQMKGRMKLQGMHKKVWNKLLGEDFTFYVEEYIYEVKK